MDKKSIVGSLVSEEENCLIEHYYVSPLRMTINSNLCRYLDWLLNFVDLKTLITCNKWVIVIHDETLGGLDNVVIRKEICLKDFFNPSETEGVNQERFYRKLYLTSKSLHMYMLTRLTYANICKYSVSVFYIKNGLLNSDKFHDKGTYIVRKPLIDILNNPPRISKPFDSLF